MTDAEARRILIQNMESLKANPLVIVDGCLYKAFDKAIQALEPRWIPVSERLPEEKNWYIVTKGFGKYRSIEEAYFDGETWLEQRLEWHKLVYAYDIIAWMPKLEPYRESEVQE